MQYSTILKIKHLRLNRIVSTASPKHLYSLRVSYRMDILFTSHFIYVSFSFGFFFIVPPIKCIKHIPWTMAVRDNVYAKGKANLCKLNAHMCIWLKQQKHIFTCSVSPYIKRIYIPIFLSRTALLWPPGGRPPIHQRKTACFSRAKTHVTFGTKRTQLLGAHRSRYMSTKVASLRCVVFIYAYNHILWQKNVRTFYEHIPQMDSQNIVHHQNNLFFRIAICEIPSA